MNDTTTQQAVPTQRTADDPVERWLPVVGYEGLYEVSDLGRVKSLKRRGVRGRVMSLFVNQGYFRVNLCRGSGVEKHSVHALVAQAFLGPRPPGLVVRHIDGDRLRSIPSNLAYATYSENNFDLVRHGRHINARKTHCRHGHEFTPENTRQRPDRNERECRTCLAKRNARKPS